MPGTVGTVFNVQHFSTDDGPGIRTTVFLKGCPLRCLWCSNPESQSSSPQLAHREATCIRCQACIAACQQEALSYRDGFINIERAKCVACGSCVRECPSGAMFMYGEQRAATDVFEEVARDNTYYKTSGGGVTASGGECMMQPDFVSELFGLCKDAGISTALDTCGYFPEQYLDLVANRSDLVLFDIKTIDPKLHKSCTGLDNKVILNNFDRMLELGMELVARVPVIPGWNDSDEQLGRIADFVASRDKAIHIDVLPYHKYGLRKYELLGMPYHLNNLEPVGERERVHYEQVFSARGLDVSVRK